jgi:Mrp family chromosome partitioning ATPase
MLEDPHVLTHVKKVIGVVSGKGGVGKSIVTSMLAVLLRRRGYKTAILDADITGPSIPQAFGLHTRAEGSDQGIFPVLTKTGVEVMSMNLLLENETDPVVWRGPIIAGSVKQFWTDVLWGDVDIMFIDMPPGTGDVPLTVFQSIPVDGIVVVTSPQQLVSMIVEKAVHMAGMMNIPVLALVQNMSFVECPGCKEIVYPFGKSDIKALAQKHSIPATAELPIQSALATACDAGLIELFEGEWLSSLADQLESMIKSEKK